VSGKPPILPSRTRRKTWSVQAWVDDLLCFTSHVECILEGVDSAYASWLQNPDPNNAPRKLLEAVLGRIAAAAPRPDEVTLVLAGDFAASVQRRLPADHPPYTTDRAGGVAIAKTMDRDDGGYDIVMGIGWLFGRGDEEEQEEALWRVDNLLHTAIHEAQHVATGQRGEATNGARATLGRAGVHSEYVASAGVVMEEYRAVIVATREHPRCDDDISVDCWLSTLESVDAALQHAASTLDETDVTPTCNAVFGTAHTMWISLGYLAAGLRAIDHDLTDGERRKHELWWRLADPYWDDFVAILAKIPPADTPMDKAELDAVVLELADLLPVWLNEIGFEYCDDGEGRYFGVLA